jgi:hypothetical protein
MTGFFVEVFGAASIAPPTYLNGRRARRLTLEAKNR